MGGVRKTTSDGEKDRGKEREKGRDAEKVCAVLIRLWRQNSEG